MHPPPPIAADGVYVNGLDSLRRKVCVTLGETLVISGDGPDIIWPLDSVNRVDAPPDELRLRSSKAAELARLTIVDEAMRAAIVERCLLATRDASNSDVARIVLWSLAAAASIVLLIVYALPFVADRLAPIVPRSFEARLGDMVDGQFKTIFDARLCRGEAGQQAFAKLIAALESKVDTGAAVAGSVIASKVPNAVALPGGKVYLLDGLLRVAESPDEIAGVIAHELGHVRHRDAMRQLIRVGGMSFLLGLLFGDVTGSGALVFVTQQLTTAAYSRDVEYQADGVAIDTMHALGRPVKPLGDLLQRVTGDETAGLGSLVANHPLTQERRARFDSEDRGSSGSPLLNDDEWKALKGICGAAK